MEKNTATNRMKLNTKQQQVVDLLRDGWMLHIHGYFKPGTHSLIDATSIGFVVHHSIRISLRKKGVIIDDFRSSHYYLTDVFK